MSSRARVESAGCVILVLYSACAMTITTISQNRCFGGVQGIYAHESAETGCRMRFGVYLPPQAVTGRVPTLYWLSGLTCTEENFIVKAGAQRIAAELGIALIVPDTSPRGLDIPGEAASYDFGLGAASTSMPPRCRGHGATGCIRTS
jgi:S-formylglutathione hydrolase